MTNPEPRRVAVIPHTHWDREWYAPFQTFRMKLVDLLDELLPLLESDPSYAHFQLDGQMAVVDDYLAIRPAAEPVLRRLAGSGRLSMGPWYALPDEFLVSGETHIRNLQLGLDRAVAFGGAMEVGYLPDMFGHIAQMPQIFRLLGFNHSVVWRGVPSAVERDAFWWEAPDGSVVRAEYLLEGYGNGAFVPDDAKELVTRVGHFERDHADALTGDILWMNGTDHLLPQPWLGRVVAEGNDLQDDYELAVTSLPDYLEGQPTDGLGRWAGELRSGARANLLMGVTSNRVDVRQAAAGAERALERLAEPLAALFLPADRWPATFLDEAWLDVVRNSAHDSVCACSVDEVCDAVLHRYHEATQIADGIAERALHALATSVEMAGPLVVNPSARPRSGVVEIRLPGEGADEGMQLVSQRGGEGLMEVNRRFAYELVQGLLDHRDGFCHADVALAEDGVLEVILERRWGVTDRLSSARVVNEMRSTGEDDPAGPVRVCVRRPASRHVLVRVDDVAGYGWQTWPDGANATDVGSVTVEGDRVLDNGRVRVEIDPESGTFSIDGQAGFGRLVDGGDNGDTYNYNEPAEDRLIDRPIAATVRVDEPGPLRGRLTIEAIYRWPDRCDGEARIGERDVAVHTTVELHAGEALVRVSTAFVNPCRNHRLRAHFPLPTPATTSHAECAFTVVERGLEAEGGPTERGLATYPSRRFVQAGGVTVVHDGLLEYELVDVRDGAAHELALTLARCTGMLSQGPMAYRPLPAGPTTPMEGPQLQQPLAVRYGVQLGEVDPFAAADQAFLPLLVVDAAGGGARPSTGQALEIRGAEVSAVLREPGALVVRVFNPTSEATTVEVPGCRGWLVDLRGRPIDGFEGGFALGPHQIATARLTDED